MNDPNIAREIAGWYRKQRNARLANVWFNRAGAYRDSAKLCLDSGNKRQAVRYLSKLLKTKLPKYVSRAGWEEAQKLLEQLS